LPTGNLARLVLARADHSRAAQCNNCLKGTRNYHSTNFR
jgi:hypothetical protein